MGGGVRLDGAALDQWTPEALGSHIGYLPQSIELFEGTVAENISRLDGGATSEKIVAAAQAAGVHEMIVHLPNGYQTEVGENGTALSAGQRQLLSFARAVAHGAHVLVLDEATSSIDTETEAAIQRGIHSLMEGKTAIAVAHRLSTIQDVDRIHVLHRGKLVEQGRHEELLAQRGVYHRLYLLQYGAQEAAARTAAVS